MRPTLSLMLILTVVSIAHAQQIKVYPEPESGNAAGAIVSPTPGNWFVLTVDRKTFAITWASTQVLADGKICIFQGPPGPYAWAFIGQDGTQELGNITLGGSSPKPDPDPDPDPDPPVVPDGLWTLTKTSYKEALAIPKSAHKYVPLVKDNYDTIASQISAGAITTEYDAKLALKEANREDIPSQDRSLWSTWDTATFKILSEHETELSKSMTTVAKAFRAIAAGLAYAEEQLK